jgi:hypothetical protein
VVLIYGGGMGIITFVGLLACRGFLGADVGRQRLRIRRRRRMGPFVGLDLVDLMGGWPISDMQVRGGREGGNCGNWRYVYLFFYLV